ncbi:MAG: 16S rRNA (adenine(1518)-N(6)/adenine(1519)-N(6))-dimethyltransferase RsmA [Acholeplasmatales bacterium]|nr:16S rRNA (adenine(1518)-N(6)/adenine(1519)-N(6))-dimethyltransferase RsmA [Acholeplasmatales bacterium]
MQNKIGNKSFIDKTLNDNKLYAKKKFGQNFLKDQNILSKIVEAAELDKDTLVIEIGPGLGSLTERLCESAGFVLAYEIDTDLIPILNDNLKEHDNFIIINKDILEVDINKDLEEYESKYNKIILVANLPYYITTPIILGMLEKTKKIKKYVMMIQLEVADRICGKPKTKDYNALSIAIGYRASAHKNFNVPRTVFIPEPNVDSAVITLDLYENPKYIAKNEELFFKLIRESFNQRRKTLINNLSNTYSKDLITKMLNDFNIKPNVRSEELDIKTFVDFSNYILENGGEK